MACDSVCGLPLAFPELPTTLFAVICLGRVVSHDPYAVKRRRVALAAARTEHPSSEPFEQTLAGFTPFVEGVHLPRDAAGRRFVFPLTLASASVVRASAAATALEERREAELQGSALPPELEDHDSRPVVVCGEWELVPHGADACAARGAGLELVLKRRFVIHAAPDAAARAAASRTATSTAVAHAVPAVHATLREFLQLATERNPRWLGSLYSATATIPAAP